MSELRIPELNHYMVAGRVTRDPELKYTAAGQAICRLSIATERRFKTKDSNEWKKETTFIEAVVWGAHGEHIGQRAKKGHAVMIEGRLRLNEWEDRQSGEKRSRLELVADRVSPLEWHGSETTKGPAQAPAGGQQQVPEDDGFGPEDDIPF